jgi:hypothetical protein
MAAVPAKTELSPEARLQLILCADDMMKLTDALWRTEAAAVVGDESFTAKHLERLGRSVANAERHCGLDLSDVRKDVDSVLDGLRSRTITLVKVLERMDDIRRRVSSRIVDALREFRGIPEVCHRINPLNVEAMLECMRQAIEGEERKT